jgi:hypothetical protein
VISTPVGINCSSDCSGDFDRDVSVTLTAQAAPGHVFQGFTGACSDGVLTMDQDQNCSAVFTLESGSGVTLTVTIQGGPGAGQVHSVPYLPSGLYCMRSYEQSTTVCTHTFSNDEMVNLRANPHHNGEMAHWSGCDNSSDREGTCSLVMTADRQVSVLFGP